MAQGTWCCCMGCRASSVGISGLFGGEECSVQNLHFHCREQAIVPEGGTFYEQFEPGTNHIRGYWCGLTERIEEFFHIQCLREVQNQGQSQNMFNSLNKEENSDHISHLKLKRV